MFKAEQPVSVRISVGDELLGAGIQLLHSLTDSLCAAANITHRFHDYTVGCTLAEPESNRSRTLSVGTAASTDLHIEVVTEIPVQALLQVDGADAVVSAESLFQLR